MADYFMILTNWGRNAVADAIANGTDIGITQVAVGDGTSTPTEAQTALESQQYIAAANVVERDSVNLDWVNVELVIPPETGGWYVREVGIFAGSDLFAVGKFPETYKPTMDEGSGKELVIKAVLEVSNAADVTLIIDPTVVLATRQYVSDEIDAHEAADPAHPAAKISFDNAAAGLDGDPDNVQDAITAAAASGGGGTMVYDTLVAVTMGDAAVGSDPEIDTKTFSDSIDQTANLHLDVDADLIGQLPAGKKLKLQLLCARGAYTTGTDIELDLSARTDPDGSTNAITKTGIMADAHLWTEDDLQWRNTNIELTATEYGTAACIVVGQVTRDTANVDNIDAPLKVVRDRWVVVDA